MSREIKFRVWSYEDKEYRTDCNLTQVFNSMTGMPATVYGEEGDRFDIEQYTGLKDKNGKEIYEGDVVALLFGYVPMKSVTTENIRIETAQKAVIHFDTARAAFRYTIKQRTPKDCQFKLGTRTNMVVIGNIHENPELLGGKDGE